MKPRLKICGITRLEDARFCAGAGVDYLGFIQYPGSPRYIDPRKAREIIEWVSGPETVGVFVNETAETIDTSVRQAGFTMVQLHGHESPETCSQVEVPVIKAIQVMHDASAEQLRLWMEPYIGHVSYFLLDTFHTSLYGGTGESFNWRLARDLATEFPLFLAGGIDATNLEEAIETIRPFAIDVSSKLESEPGVKDFDKMSAFFDAYHRITKDTETTA